MRNRSPRSAPRFLTPIWDRAINSWRRSWARCPDPDQVTPPDNFVNSSGLKDNALVQAVNKQPWDPSVKA
ncbi:MAG TPA: hypothetical protein VF772_10915, partial [Terriglobales bacterium]